MSLLSWRAAQRDDRAALQQFTCTAPLRPYLTSQPTLPRHDKPWELDVQSGIRVLQPPLGSDQILMIGEDASGVAAVSLSAEQDGSAALVKLRAIAVATRLRGLGGGYADEAFHIALEAIEARARNEGLKDSFVVGWIDPRNNASKLMCERAGLAYLGETQGALEEWGIVVEIG